MTLDAKFAQELSDFLHQRSTVAALIDATKRGLPAVEGIDSELLGYFGDRVRQAPVKQSIGRNIRAIMGARGYVPAKRKPTNSGLFKTGKVYQRPQPILEILSQHGLELREDDVCDEIKNAIAPVAENAPQAALEQTFDWTRNPNLNSTPTEGPLLIFTVTVDRALKDANARRHTAMPTSQLTYEERRLINHHAPPGQSSNRFELDPETRTAFKLGAICATSLSPPQAAHQLGKSPTVVNGWIRKRHLYTLNAGLDATTRIPLFQLNPWGALIPHMDAINPRLDAHIHPVGVFNWFTSPNPDLATQQTDYQPTSPRDWLLHDYSPEPIAQLAANLSVGTPA